MALARLTVKTGGKGKAGPHANYIARDGKYKKNEKLEKLEYVGYGNMPTWAQKDPSLFWKSADEFERKNGTTYREHIISLPRELTEQQRHELITDWIGQELGERHPYQYAIHNPIALDGEEQPHAHIMFSERTNDEIERGPDTFFKRYNAKNPECGGAKKANTGIAPKQRKLELKEQRERLENCYNKHLEIAGLNIRVSMKSLKERGISRNPVNISMTEIAKGSNRVEAYKKLLEDKKALADLRVQQRAEFKELVEEAQQKEAQQKQAQQKQAQQKQAQLEAQQKQAQLEAQQKQAQLEAQQKQAQIERLKKTSPFELMNIRVIVNYRDRKGKTITDDYKLGSEGLYLLVNDRLNNRLKITNIIDSHIEINTTAYNIKEFMLRNLTNTAITADFGSLTTEKFVSKYAIEHDFSDLDKQTTIEQENTLKNANTEQIGASISNDKDSYDFDM